MRPASHMPLAEMITHGPRRLFRAMLSWTFST